MKLSSESRQLAKSLLTFCRAGEGRVDDSRVRLAVEKILKEKPRQYLAVLTRFKKLIALELAKRAVTVQSAVPLESDQQQNVMNFLEGRYGKGLSAAFEVKPELHGGLLIKVGSDVWDGSIKNRLERLKAMY
ncbi:MAG: F0F1 ATP synthase subunit delta [Verrucomicrobiae bacterium]|nr:F0F1 ATP synthase subunit delta [Verrucomicrobiae bacterium]